MNEIINAQRQKPDIQVLIDGLSVGEWVAQQVRDELKTERARQALVKELRETQSQEGSQENRLRELIRDELRRAFRENERRGDVRLRTGGGPAEKFNYHTDIPDPLP